MSPVRLSLLGGFGLWIAGRDVALPKKTQALLAYLALNPTRSIPRERLATLLWDDASDTQGRSSLRQALSGLRKELSTSGHDTTWTEADALCIGPEVSSDVAEFRRAAQGSSASDLQHACTLYTGELLPAFHARSLQFDNWLGLEREHLRREILGVVQRFSDLPAELRDEAQTMDALRRWIAIDPVDERPRRQLMSHLAATGRSAQALEEYRALREALRRELAMNPEPATEQLHAQIRKDRASPAAAPSLAADKAAAQAPDAMAQAADAIASDVLRVVTVALVRLDAFSHSNLDTEDEARIALQLEALLVRLAPEANVVLAPNHDAVVTWGTHRGNEAEVALRTVFAALRSLAQLSGRAAVAQGSALLAANGQFTGRATAVVSELVAHACAGQVLADASVGVALAGRLIATPLPAAPGTWLVSAVTDPSDGETTPFVGRSTEFALLGSQLEACIEQRRCGVVLVRAEAGMGKSRLLGALRTHALDLGASCHVAQALDFGQSSNSRLLAALTLSLAELALDADAQTRLRRLQSVADEDPELASHLVHLLELVNARIPSALAPLQKALDAAARASGRRAALGCLLRWVSSRSAVLVELEDMHWSSAEERALVAELVADSQLAPVLFVLSTRIAGDRLDAQWRTSLQGSVVSMLELGPLPLADARTLAGLHAALPPAIVESCIARAQGLPLFLDQLLRAAASGQTQLPGSVRASVVGRLDVLAPSDRALVYAAAVLGLRGPLPALCALAQRDDTDAELIARTGLLALGRGEWSFRHALFREAVYDSLLKAPRATLHSRAADWYRERDVVLYADHLAAAGDARAAAAYLAGAKFEAEAQRNAQALYCAERARELSNEPESAVAAACLIGTLQLSAGATHAALSAFRGAVELAGSARATAEAWLGVAAVLRVLDRQTEALEALDHAAPGLPSAEPLLSCKWWTLRGNVMFSLDFEACRQAHEQALHFARLAGSELDEVLAVGGLGDAYYQRGLMLTAYGYFTRCVEQCRSIGSLASLLAYLPMSAITSLYQGDFAGAALQSQEALRLAEQIGSPRPALLAEVAAGCLHLYRSEYDLAEQHAQRSLALSKSIGAARFEAEAHGMVGVALFGLGRAAEAAASLRRARELAIGSHSAYAGPFVLAHLARVTEDPVEREQLLAEGERVLERGAIGSNAMEYFTAAIDVNLRMGNFERALQLADRLEEATRAEPLRWCQLAVRRARTFAELSAADDAARQRGIQRFNAEVTAIGFLSLRLPPAEP